MDKKLKRRVAIFWILILAALFYSLLSCSPVKRLDRLQKKHSYLFEKKIDTLRIYDTTEVMIPGIKLDTTFQLFKLSAPGGITLSKENLHINLFHDAISNDIFLNARVDTIYKTIYKEIKVPYNRYIIDPPKPSNKKVWVVFLWIFLILLLVILLIIIINYFKNR